MDSTLTRRTFLGGTAASLGFAIAGGGSLEAFARPMAGAPLPPVTGYGSLIQTPGALLALPEGFSYKVVAQTGSAQPGRPAFPSDPDGMAVFARPGGGSILICNHEIVDNETLANHPGLVPVPQSSRITYDTGAKGGTSTIEVDAEGNYLNSYISVAGTNNNCAGGVTPWGTWLTCEETERGPTNNTNLQQRHGYVFEVDPESQASNFDKSPVPLKFLGRYSHEAVAVDPIRHDIYLTEDAVNPNGLYYRWRPPRGFRGEKGALPALALAGDDVPKGQLQAMSCYKGRRHIVDLSAATRPGTRYRVRWVDVPDPDASALSTRVQSYALPVTRSRKLEGAWWGNGGAYFVASFARPEENGDGSWYPHDGQVWFYDPNNRTVTLTTIFRVNPTPNAVDTWDRPDNITVSPHGGLILAEDGLGLQHLIGVTRRGDIYPLARNMIDIGANDSEFAGPTFSKDGRILFVNLYTPGYTFAITGPWTGGSTTGSQTDR